MNLFDIGIGLLCFTEIGIPGENHRPAASHRQTLSHNIVLSALRLSGIRNHNVKVICTDCIGSCKYTDHDHDGPMFDIEEGIPIRNVQKIKHCNRDSK